MFVRLKSSKKSRTPTIQIVEGIREEGKVKQRVIASLGSATDQKNLKKLLKLAEHLLEKLQNQGVRLKRETEST